MDKCCGTCKWWDIDDARDKAGRVRANRVASCCWPPFPLPTAARIRVIPLGYMLKKDGTTCPTYQPKEAERE